MDLKSTTYHKDNFLGDYGGDRLELLAFVCGVGIKKTTTN